MLYRIKTALMRFMSGRYGVDTLNRALLISYIAIAVIRFIVMIFSDSITLYVIFDLLLWAIIIVTFARMLSRNIYARQRENTAYLQFSGGIGNRAKVIIGNIKERDKKYVICPSCKAVIRFPRKKGKHTAKCPKCKSEMIIKI